MTTAADVNNRRGSRIVLQNPSGDERVDPSGGSTPAPGREDVTTCGCILLRRIRPMFMILAALHEGEVPSNVPNEEPSRNAPGLHQAETQSEARSLEKRGDQGMVAGRSSEAPPEQISGDDHVEGGEYDAVKSEKSKSECPSRSITRARTDLSTRYRKSPENQGDWEACTRVRYCQGVQYPQCCPGSHLRYL